MNVGSLTCSVEASVDAETGDLRMDIIDAAEDQLLRGQSWSDRLRIAAQLFLATRNMVAVAVRAEHPQLDDLAVAHEVSRRLLHDSLAH